MELIIVLEEKCQEDEREDSSPMIPLEGFKHLRGAQKYKKTD